MPWDVNQSLLVATKSCGLNHCDLQKSKRNFPKTCLPKLAILRSFQRSSHRNWASPRNCCPDKQLTVTSGIATWNCVNLKDNFGVWFYIFWFHVQHLWTFFERLVEWCWMVALYRHNSENYVAFWSSDVLCDFVWSALVSLVISWSAFLSMSSSHFPPAPLKHQWWRLQCLEIMTLDPLCHDGLEPVSYISNFLPSDRWEY